MPLKLTRHAFEPEELERGTEKQRLEKAEIIITDYAENKSFRIKLMRVFEKDKTKIAEWNVKGPCFNRNFTAKRNSSGVPDYILPGNILIYQSDVSLKSFEADIAIDAPSWVTIRRLDTERNNEKEDIARKEGDKEKAYREASKEKKKRVVYFSF